MSIKIFFYSKYYNDMIVLGNWSPGFKHLWKILLSIWRRC